MAINYPVIFKTDTSALDKAGGSLKKFGGIAASVGAAAGAAIAGIAVTSIKEFAKFDSALNKSISIMGDVSDTLQDDMAQAAKDVAKTTSFSAEQAAESYFFLASAGLDAAASVEAMPQVAAFAQAGMFDMATATDLATDAQSALGLASDDAGENLENLTRVTDVFVAANTLANTSVEQLAAAMTSKAGNALKTVGKDIEEGSAALAVFADQGIKGERAGTLLTNTLFGLTDNAQKNAGAFKELGIEVFEADGSMKNMADIANSVTTAFDGMSEEQKLAELSALGFTKQTREGVLALAGNGETLAEYEEALRNAGGTADEVAQNQLNTLDAQFGLLKDTIGVVAIEIGEQFNEPLRDMLKAINPIVDAAGPKFVDFFGNIADGVGGAAEKLSFFVENMPQIDKALEVAFASGGVVGVIEEFLSLFFENFSFEALFEKINAMAMQLRLAVIDAIPGIVDGLVELIPQFVSFITETLIPRMLENSQLILTELIAMIQEVLPMLAEGISELIPQLVQSLADLLPVILDTILGFIPDLLETGLTVFNSIVDSLVQMIPQLIDTLVELLPKLVNTLMEMLPDIIDAGLDLFMGIIDALVETIPILLDAIVEAFPKITGQLIEMLPKIIEASLTLFFGIIDGLVKAIPDILNAVVDMIPEITTQLVAMLPDIIDASMDLFFGIIDGLFQATPEILAEVIALIPEITAALIGEIPKLVQAAFELLTGLARGLIDNAPRVIGNAMASVGETVVNGFKDFLGIQSPSKVFMGLGKDIVDGLDEGIRDNASVVKTTSEDMAKVVRDIFDSTLDQVAGTTQEIMREGAKIQAQFGENGEVLRSYTTSERGMEAAIQDGQANFQRVTNDINSLYKFMGETTREGMKDIQDTLFGGSMQQAINQLQGQVTLTNPETGMRKTIGGTAEGVSNAVERAMSQGFTEALGKTSFTDEQILKNIQGLTEQVAERGLTPFADGGIVTSPTAGLVGEAGAEAIIPLDRYDNMKGTENYFNITVNTGVGTDPVAVGREVVNAIKRYESTNGKVFATA